MVWIIDHKTQETKNCYDNFEKYNTNSTHSISGLINKLHNKTCGQHRDKHLSQEETTIPEKSHGQM